MKITYIFLLTSIMLLSTSAYSQTKGAPRTIITTKGINKYHSLKELEELQKGQLKELYIERFKMLTNILPYIALTNKPGVTMKDLGIPESAENVKALEKEAENRTIFMNGAVEFLNTMVSYSDKSSQINAILFYEEILKKIHLGNEE